MEQEKSEKRSRAWQRFTNFAIIFSFTVNCILVLVLLLAIIPLLQLKSDFVEPLLTDLDTAFQALGETTIDVDVDVDETIPISFTLPMSQPLDLDFDLTIDEDTVVILNQAVPLDNLPARFLLPGGGGVINGTVSLALPYGMRLPVQLNMTVPVQKTIPVQLTVPVNQPVPIVMHIPVSIQLGEAGLDPAVEQLRGVFSPLSDILNQIPDGISFR